MRIKYTLTEAEVKQAVEEWLENNHESELRGTVEFWWNTDANGLPNGVTLAVDTE